MKVFINPDEWYPYFRLRLTDNGLDFDVDLTQEEFDRFKKADDEINACHNMVEDRLKAQGKSWRP